jgi:hypothetical protein
MTKSKKAAVESPTKPYPPEQAFRSGFKVSWNYYDTREDADKCAEIARNNAAYYREKGYDFGYCSPGSVEWAKPGNWPQAGENGRWEVCLP